jgi:hypothetical protein
MPIEVQFFLRTTAPPTRDELVDSADLLALTGWLERWLMTRVERKEAVYRPSMHMDEIGVGRVPRKCAMVGLGNSNCDPTNQRC